jgi:hypothetical protein
LWYQLSSGFEHRVFSLPVFFLWEHVEVVPDPQSSLLYEQFLAAREDAIKLTDRFRASDPTDPARLDLWDAVLRQTELARALLERWLSEGEQLNGTTRI